MELRSEWQYYIFLLEGNSFAQLHRKIIHIDMDAFYASVEQRDNPELKGKPIAVGGGEKRGVLTTCSYEARKYGVRSAMPGYRAKELCPDIIFVKPRFDAYNAVSKQIRNIFHEYTDLIEPLSLDEAFLDVTDCKKDITYATDIAKALKLDILEETKLTASAGVSYCKFIAKIASDMNKPDGLTVIKPHQAIAFLEKLKIEKFFGVGKVTAAKMRSHGIYTGKDLKKWNKIDLVKHFGKPGKFYFDIVRGIDERPVQPHRVRKSLAVERTTEDDMIGLEVLKVKLDEIIDKLVERLNKAEKHGRTITLKLKTADFKIITRSKSMSYPVQGKEEIRAVAMDLLENNYIDDTPIRLIGLTSSNFIQPSDNQQDDAQLRLDL